ncbi:MAG: GntR family transcriptional regulator [Micrococcus sp.]|nr:GntR family transcriptional regulator [Micrococcus sp.]
MIPPFSANAIQLPQLTDSRQTSHEVHSHLRQLILNGVLPPGAVLKQAELARRFGISRTPMREAFRRLQEEDLITADPNQRAVVRSMDGEELDQLYSTRIALESLGARITTGRLEEEEIEEAQQCLRDMDVPVEPENQAEWMQRHRRFHEICVARAGQPMLKVIQSYAERSERYVRLYWMWHPQAHLHAKADHQAILEAVQGGDSARAGSLMAQHLSHTALTVLGDVSVDAPGVAIQEALAMATGKKSVARR